MSLEDIIKNQEREAEILEKFDDELYELTNEYKKCCEKIPLEEILKEHNIQLYDNNIKNLEQTQNLYITNKTKFDEIINKLKQLPEYEESCAILNKREKIKYLYYAQFYIYWKLIHDDREKYFSSDYKKTLELLAQDGIFLYFMQTPDLNFDNIKQNEIKDYVLNSFKEYNYLNLKHLLSNILNPIAYSNELHRNKISDLKEALECLQNKHFNSCARTMFAMLENEQKMASGLIKKSSNKNRLEEISKFVLDMGVEYYIKVWNLINNYYSNLLKNTNEQKDDEVNRHDLAHGIYNKTASEEDCIKLILMYLSFKEISYILQNFKTFKEELNNDLMLLNFMNSIKGEIV